MANPPSYPGPVPSAPLPELAAIPQPSAPDASAIIYTKDKVASAGTDILQQKIVQSKKHIQNHQWLPVLENSTEPKISNLWNIIKVVLWIYNFLVNRAAKAILFKDNLDFDKLSPDDRIQRLTEACDYTTKWGISSLSDRYHLLKAKEIFLITEDDREKKVVDELKQVSTDSRKTTEYTLLETCCKNISEVFVKNIVHLTGVVPSQPTASAIEKGQPDSKETKETLSTSDLEKIVFEFPEDPNHAALVTQLLSHYEANWKKMETPSEIDRINFEISKIKATHSQGTLDAYLVQCMKINDLRKMKLQKFKDLKPEEAHLHQLQDFNRKDFWWLPGLKFNEHLLEAETISLALTNAYTLAKQKAEESKDKKEYFKFIEFELLVAKDQINELMSNQLSGFTTSEAESFKKIKEIYLRAWKFFEDKMKMDGISRLENLNHLEELRKFTLILNLNLIEDLYREKWHLREIQELNTTNSDYRYAKNKALLNKIQEDLNNLKETIEKNELQPSGLVYLNKCLKLLSVDNENPTLLYQVYTLLGNYYEKQNDFVKAGENYLLAKDASKTKDFFGRLLTKMETSEKDQKIKFDWDFLKKFYQLLIDRFDSIDNTDKYLLKRFTLCLALGLGIDRDIIAARRIIINAKSNNKINDKECNEFLENLINSILLEYDKGRISQKELDAKLFMPAIEDSKYPNAVSEYLIYNKIFVTSQILFYKKIKKFKEAFDATKEITEMESRKKMQDDILQAVFLELADPKCSNRTELVDFLFTQSSPSVTKFLVESLEKEYSGVKRDLLRLYQAYTKASQIDKANKLLLSSFESIKKQRDSTHVEGQTEEIEGQAPGGPIRKEMSEKDKKEEANDSAIHIKLLQLAYDKEDALGAKLLGDCYLNEYLKRPIQKNISSVKLLNQMDAIRCYQLAAKKGNGEAQIILADSFEHGSNGLQIDLQAAKAKYLEASKQPYPSPKAFLGLARILENEMLASTEMNQKDKLAQEKVVSIPENKPSIYNVILFTEKALELFKKLEEGNKEGMASGQNQELITMKEYAKSNLERIFKTLKAGDSTENAAFYKAINLTKPQQNLILALCYERGLGTEVDITQAYLHFQNASNSGNDEATEILNQRRKDDERYKQFGVVE